MVNKEFQELMALWKERFIADDLSSYKEVMSIKKLIKTVGQKAHAEHGIDGLMMLYNTTPGVAGMKRFVELAFDGIGEWRG